MRGTSPHTPKNQGGSSASSGEAEGLHCLHCGYCSRCQSCQEWAISSDLAAPAMSSIRYLQERTRIKAPTFPHHSR